MKPKFEGITLTREQVRSQYDPNYHVYVMVETEKLPLGETPEEWEYYLSDVHLTEVQEATNPPPLVKKFNDAFNIVGLVTWNLYLIPTYSKLKKREVEHQITAMLEARKYKVSVFVYPAPEVIEREVIQIPINAETLTKLIDDAMKGERSEFALKSVEESK